MTGVEVQKSTRKSPIPELIRSALVSGSRNVVGNNQSRTSLESKLSRIEAGCMADSAKGGLRKLVLYCITCMSLLSSTSRLRSADFVCRNCSGLDSER